MQNPKAPIRVAVFGYGNLGKGTVNAISQSPDMELVCVFSRRDPALLSLPAGVRGVSIQNAASMKDEIDVLILCGGSATDLPVQTPEMARLFNTVDSFDTHAKIPAYFNAVNSAASETGHLSAISVGWDPGLFSLNRLYAESILPVGKTYTFWGRGVSQGHSDAIRRLSGVKNAVQYTVPVDSAVESVRRGENPELSTRDKHLRVCFVVAEEGADKTAIENAIVTMPNYFADYNTEVNFIDEETFLKEHSTMPHGGFVIRSGDTADGNRHIIEYSLSLESNPAFTSSVLVATARAVARIHAEGKKGALSLFDIPPSYLSPLSGEQLRQNLL